MTFDIEYLLLDMYLLLLWILLKIFFTVYSSQFCLFMINTEAERLKKHMTRLILLIAAPRACLKNPLLEHLKLSNKHDISHLLNVYVQL